MLHAKDSHSSSTSHPVPATRPAAEVRTAQQTKQKYRVLRSDYRGRAIHFQDGGVLHCKPSGRDACTQQMGRLGGCWGMQTAGASLQGHVLQAHTCSAPHSVSHLGMHSVLNPVPSMGQHRKGSTGMVWVPLPLAGVTQGSTGCPGRETGPVPAHGSLAERFQQIQLCSSPSTTLLVSHLCSGPDSHPALSLPSITHSFCV